MTAEAVQISPDLVISTASTMTNGNEGIGAAYKALAEIITELSTSGLKSAAGDAASGKGVDLYTSADALTKTFNENVDNINQFASAYQDLQASIANAIGAES
jgi:hypothetical protein